MTDYINRETLVHAVHNDPSLKDYLGLQERCLKLFKSVPATDVAPVVHGEWIDRGYAANGDMIGMCSACRRTFRGMKEIGSVGRYCHNCGAKMDGGKNNALD